MLKIVHSVASEPWLALKSNPEIFPANAYGDEFDKSSEAVIVRVMVLLDVAYAVLVPLFEAIEAVEIDGLVRSKIH